MIKKWETLNSKIAFDEKRFTIRRDTVRLPNGKVFDDFYVWVQGEFSIIVALTSNDELVLVKQYRHGFGDILIECPAGMMDPGENELETAKRELLEETGYEAATIEKIGTFVDKPAKVTSRAHVFLTTDVSLKSSQDLDESEDIEVLLIPFKEVFDMIGKGEFIASTAVAAVYMAAERLGRITIK